MCVSNISLVAEADDDPESRWFGEAPLRYGPYEYTGNLYTIHCVNDYFSGDVFVQINVFRSTDGGTTWTLHNSLAAPSSPNTLQRLRLNITQVGPVLYYTWLRRVSGGVNFNTGLAIGKYDISSDTFTHTLSTSGPHVTSNTDKASSFDFISVDCRSTASCYISSEDAIYVLYSNIVTDPTAAFTGFNYYYTKVAIARYSIPGNSWTTGTPFPQTGTKTYGAFNLLQGDGSFIHAFISEIEVNAAVSFQQVNPKMHHYALSYAMAALDTEVVHNDIAAIQDLSSPAPIKYTDGTNKLMLGFYEDVSLNFKLFVGADSTSPGFAQAATTLASSTVDSGATFLDVTLTIWLLTRTALYWNGNYNLFLCTTNNAGSVPFTSTLWRVEFTGGVWTSCEILNTSGIPASISASNTWAAEGIGVYPDLSFGDFISWGLIDYEDQTQYGNFYTALIEAEAVIVPLTVSVSDQMFLYDHIVQPVPFSPSTGIIVETCPDIIVSSSFCSSIKTSVDGETQIHDCEETLYSETTQPCEELANQG